MERPVTATEAAAAAVDERAVSAPVEGGELVGTLWHEGAPGTPVVAIHGITANHRSFSGLAAQLDAPVLALDLRGRGASRDLPGPYDLVQQARDVAEAMTALGIARAIVVGHSMGGFVAGRLAQARPELVAALVLVDGGVPLRPAPADAKPEDILGPALERLRRTFADAEEYRAFFRAHPGFGPYWSPAIEEYVDYDLREIDGALRPSANPDAVVTNLVELDGRDGYAEALPGIEAPTVLLRSPRDLLDQAPGLYDDQWLATWTARLPRLDVTDVEGTNHYTILLGEGVGAVADAVRGAASSVQEEGR